MQWGKAWLLGMSLWFYAYFNIKYLPIIILSICFNYAMNRRIVKSDTAIRKKAWLAVAVIVNIGILFYYKYYDFFIVNVNTVFKSDFHLHGLILPLGISFFTFQQLSYVIDSYKGEVPSYNFLDYALFVTYFPQLIAGPIVTHDEIVPQFADTSKKQVNYENLSKGIMAFSLGLAKKVLLADTFGNAVNWGYENVASLDTTNALLIMLFYTFQIYFDFSGYCDMATGIGLMFNIDITMNFNSPYRALTITEFWKRWHITLTRFFTRYVYIPLGGNRKGNARTYLNIFIVFVVSGLWHGANWTFVLWGIIHGVFSLLTRSFQKQVEKLHPALNWIVTFGFVNVAWVYFRAASIGQANQIIKNILKLNFGSISSSIQNVFNMPEFSVIAKLLKHWIFGDSRFYLLLFTAFSFFAILHMKNTNERVTAFKPSIWISCVSIVLLVWCIISFSGVSTFLYFNF